MFITPTVRLLHSTPLGVAELAARTAYDSFDKSIVPNVRDNYLQVQESELLQQLSWVYFHESVLEHLVMTFEITDMSRGVLQELVRHRIASYTVKSTRYTLNRILIAYLVASDDMPFKELVPDIFAIDKNTDQIALEYLSLSAKLMGAGVYPDILSKDQLNYYKRFHKLLSSNTLFNKLMKMPSKRNIGDKYKWVVTDTFRTNVVLTINARSLKNFLKLRMSNSAWAPMQILAEEIYKTTPKAIQPLVVKEK